MPSTITFYGGVHEIGGNKFLVEDKGTKIFLDFGMQMGKVNQYFTEFLNPRICNGMGDLFAFELLPKLKGLYRKDYAKHMGFDGSQDNEIDAVILTHAHVDHAAYIHYLRPSIPIYCSDATKLIMQAFQDTGSFEEYVTFKENFMVKLNPIGDLSKIKGKEMSYPRKVRTFQDSKKFNIDSIEVEVFPVDHSLPGACGFIVHTSTGSIGYTGDIRFHGRRRSDTQKFVERCGNSGLNIFLCEGTRIHEDHSKTELDVEEDIIKIVNNTENLVVCSYPARDLDRALSFYNAAKQSGRELIIDLKQAYILKLFQTSDNWKSVYPKPKDKAIKIYVPKKGWGLIDKDIDYWGKKMLLEDYQEAYSSAASQLIIEGWNAEVVVTTFVQFLETVIGTSASSLRKLHNITGSIVILDEVQSIDYKHWLLIHDCLEFIANEFDVRIILMTATQPLIFKKDEVFELFDIKQGFSERVRFEIDLRGISIKEFLIKLDKIITDNQRKSILIIMNTISSAVSVFENVTAPKEEKFYLSSEVVPVERQERIKKISNRLITKRRTILISTQVVEAGVDFDFDIVVRDLAPIDSIVQAAGRCNHNGERPSSESPVYLFAVHDGNENYFGIRIYGNILIDKTREALQEKESNISELVDIYYQKVNDVGSRQKSLEILTAINELNYEEIEKRFKVIEEEPTVSVFVEIDKEAEDVWTEYRNISSNPCLQEEQRKRKLRDFFRTKRSLFYSYTINSRPSFIEQQEIPFEKPFYHISRQLLSRYYGYTGLKRARTI